MKRIIGFAAMVTGILMLVSCRGADISISKGDDTKKTAPEITLHTMVSEDSPRITLHTDEQDSSTQPPVEQDSQIGSTDEPAWEAVTEPPLEEVQPLEEFEFPEEFYPLMGAILEKYQLNLNCEGGEDCACKPEYEVVAEDGTVIEPREKVVSVYYYDINSGFEYALNPGAHYPVASSVKIPFCTMIYKKIAAGELFADTVLTYEQRHYFEGTGVIVQGDFGQEFTVSQLLTLAITRSDNVAYEMLKDLVTWDEFSEYLGEIGCTHLQDVRRSKQKLCCESAGAYGRDLAEFLRSDIEGLDVYREDLLNTRVKMIVSDYPIYRKYGWTNFAFHDIAYVDAPRPYVLAVLTNLEGEEQSDYKMYREISQLIEKASQKEKLGE